MKKLIASLTLAAMLGCSITSMAYGKEDTLSYKQNIVNKWYDIDIDEPFEDVPLDAELQRYIIEKAHDANIAPEVVMAIIWRESSFNPMAVGDGGLAVGLMQIQPKWYRDEMFELGITDVSDPYQNVKLGIRILEDLKNQYEDLYDVLTYYRYGTIYGDHGYAEQVSEYAYKLTR